MSKVKWDLTKELRRVKDSLKLMVEENEEVHPRDMEKILDLLEESEEYARILYD